MPDAFIPRALVRGCSVLTMAVAQLSVAAAPPLGEPAQALRVTHQRIAGQLDGGGFGRPMTLESSETANGLQGDVYVVVEHPLADIAAALRSPAHWCELLVLHINNRRCRVMKAEGGKDRLVLSVVRRYDKPIADAFELGFAYRVAHESADHLDIDMFAASGPLGTRNYRVGLEAVALDARRSFLHFDYRYEDNAMVRMATQAYLATFGSHKVGFSADGTGADGTPQRIRGMRGLVERNAMRYFLALEAYLQAMDAPDTERAERRQRDYFAGTERYPAQLREVDLATYLALKRADRERDAATPR